MEISAQESAGDAIQPGPLAVGLSACKGGRLGWIRPRRAWLKDLLQYQLKKMRAYLKVQAIHLL